MDNNPGQPDSAPLGTLPRTAMPAAITGWIRGGTLDAPLAGLVSIMVEHGLPLVVAARSDAWAAGWAGTAVRDALGRTLLGCALPPARPVRTSAPVTADAGSLEAVLARMPLLSSESADDAGARVALVLVLGTDADTWRVSAAHLLRPPLRDGHGHLQRQGPAVLATWDPGPQRFEHFSWAVTAELARLVDRKAGDLEGEIAARTDLLAGLCDHRVEDPGAVRLAIQAARTAADATSRRH
ncbi:MAG TPA: hypothetical protein VID26_00650 [Candidatus Limnocylindrales bacterium]